MDVIDGVDIPIIYKSELNSNANMIVLCKEFFIFQSTGKTCNVKPFTSKLGIAQNVPIVDTAVAYISKTYYKYRNTVHISYLKPSSARACFSSTFAI